MSNVSTHFVIGKRITLHFRIGSGADGKTINFDSDELYIVDEQHRLHQVLTHIKYVLVPEVACMAIDHADDLKIVRAAIHMQSTNHRSKVLDSGLRDLVKFLAKVM